jgi:hypothetical protein
MSDKTLNFIGKWQAIIALLITLAGGAQAFFLLPYRVAANEKRVDQLVVEAGTNHELLVRIDERVARLTEDSKTKGSR